MTNIDPTPERSWLRRPRTGSGIDWDFVARWALTIAFIGVGLQVLWIAGPRGGRPVEVLFQDATLYYRATEAWLAGANPWQVRLESGVPFAAPPTALLLNLPLVPFGEGIVRPFWAIAGLVGWVFAMRCLRLPPWWILFPPFLEGWLAGSPDPALFGLIVAGAGAVAAVAKPYSIPSMIADRRWRSLVLGGLILVVTLPLLPWGQFFNELDTIRDAFTQFSRHLSAWGDPIAMLVVAVALVRLGPALGLRLAVPGLWPGTQLHYLIFSARAGADSAFLALALAVPGYAPAGIVVYAAWVTIRPRFLAVSRRPAAEKERATLEATTTSEVDAGEVRG